MRRAAILIGLLLGLSVPAVAEDAAPAPAPPPSADGTAAPAIRVGPRWVACTDEVQKFCAGTDRGQGWVKTCLKPHFKDLSDPCKAIIGPEGEKAE